MSKKKIPTIPTGKIGTNEKIKSLTFKPMTYVQAKKFAGENYCDDTFNELESGTPAHKIWFDSNCGIVEGISYDVVKASIEYLKKNGFEGEIHDYSIDDEVDCDEAHAFAPQSKTLKDEVLTTIVMKAIDA